jgi:hypothetical protein
MPGLGFAAPGMTVDNWDGAALAMTSKKRPQRVKTDKKKAASEDAAPFFSKRW